MSIKTQQALYLKAKQAYYYSDKPIMSDSKFDELEDWLKAACPKWPELKKTGAPIANKKKEVKHTHFMPSLNKKYPEKIDPWLIKNLCARVAVTAYALIMAKIDGTSLQITYSNGVPVRLVTRGDGVLGQDISYLIPHLNLPQKIKVKSTTVFRLEAVMPSSVFAKKWQTKGDERTKDDFNDARGMANGLFNRQLKGKPHPAFKDIKLYVLGVYGHRMGEGLKFAAIHGFDVVPYEIVYGPKAKISAEYLVLSDRLAAYKKNKQFEADGLVIVNPETPMVFKDSKKPGWAIAYKENDLSAAVKVTVKEIRYQISGNNRINMKAIFDPTQIGTVKVKHATLHNAEWMTTRGIGPGAEILVLRSGDVIPKVVGVVKKALKLSLPKVPYELRGKFFYALDDSPTSRCERIEKFFVALGIEGMKSKSIAKMYERGMETYFDYVKLWKATAPAMPAALHYKGLGLAQAKKLKAEFDRVFGNGVTVAQLMIGSSKFPGVGMERLQKFETYNKHLPDPLRVFLNSYPQVALDMFKDMPGVKEKTIDMFMANRTVFAKALLVLDDYIKIVAPLKLVKVKVSGPLKGQRVSFTSYRDKDHEAKIIALGGEVIKLGAKTTLLLYKAGAKFQAKIDAARDKGLNVCTFEELLRTIK